MQPLHCTLSPRRNIAHDAEILHDVFKSIVFPPYIIMQQSVYNNLKKKTAFYM